MLNAIDSYKGVFLRYCCSYYSSMMYAKDLDKQYTPDIEFMFCAAVFFILMFLLQMHYIFFTLGGV